MNRYKAIPKVYCWVKKNPRFSKLGLVWYSLWEGKGKFDKIAIFTGNSVYLWVEKQGD